MRKTFNIIMGILPYGRSLAPNSSILLYSLLFSSSSQRNLPSAPLAYQSLVCPSASCPPFYPSSLLLIVPSRKTCPIFFHCTIVSTNFRISPTLSSTFSFVILSSQLTFPNLLYRH